MVRRLAIIGAMLLVAGCQSYAPVNNVPVESRDSSGPDPVQDTAPMPEPGVATAPPAAANAAVVALLDRAQRQQESLDYAAAAASLERAIRITPRDANLYFQLAGVRFEQGSWDQTVQLCRKAVSLAADSRTMELKCEALLQPL